MAETKVLGSSVDQSRRVPEERHAAPGYEEQFTAFIDFLGFSEVSKQADDTTRLKVLELLLSLSALRSEFDVQSEPNQGGGSRHQIRPAVSTFSDHIVVSYPLERIARDLGRPSDDVVVTFVVLNGFGRLLRSIAAAALRLGFLIRGGATIGKLYHSQGVVFGEAMTEAFELESRVAIYPRVVLSPRVAGRQPWAAHKEIAVCNDGLHHFDYFKTLALGAVVPGSDYAEMSKAWFQDVIAVVARKLSDLQRDGKLKELAKWVWFSHEFRRGIETTPPELQAAFGLSLSDIPWSP
jgi:hypothetical protein